MGRQMTTPESHPAEPNDFRLHGIIRNSRKRLRIFLEQKDALARILYGPHCKKGIPAEVRLRERGPSKPSRRQ